MDRQLHHWTVVTVYQAPSDGRKFNVRRQYDDVMDVITYNGAARRWIIPGVAVENCTVFVLNLSSISFARIIHPRGIRWVMYSDDRRINRRWSSGRVFWNLREVQRSLNGEATVFDDVE